MHIILTTNNINNKTILFGEKIKNNIIDNSFFYNIQYSDNLISLQNLIFNIELKNCIIQEYYNKLKFEFDEYENKVEIYNLISVESKILNLFKNTINNTKRANYKLSEQLTKGILKCNNNNINKNENIFRFKIKISGIWENNSEFGLIYKFELI